MSEEVSAHGTTPLALQLLTEAVGLVERVHALNGEPCSELGSHA